MIAMDTADSNQKSTRHWGPSRPLPVTQLLKAPSLLHGFDYTAAMVKLCRDIVRHVPVLAAVDMSRVLVTATISRKNTKYGLQARVTPMRFAGGALTTRRRGMLYGLERYFVNDVEMLYLLTFVLPRFLDRSFEEKLTTVVHELFHLSPAFDGDIRRLGGRCSAHSHSKKKYDDHMTALTREYLAHHDQPAVLEFLRLNFNDLQKTHGGARVIVVPRPRMIPISGRMTV